MECRAYLSMFKLIVNVYWTCLSCCEKSGGSLWYHSVSLVKTITGDVCRCSGRSPVKHCSLVRCSACSTNELGLALFHGGKGDAVIDSGMSRSVARKVAHRTGDAIMVVEGSIPCDVHGRHKVSSNISLGGIGEYCDCGDEDLNSDGKPVAIRLCAAADDSCTQCVCNT